MNNLKGRRKITTDVTSAELKGDLDKLYQVINVAMDTHIKNKREIDYLIDYAKGNQPILQKQKDIRPEINNTLVLNHAEMITRNIVGYFLGTPIQYTHAQGDASKKRALDMFNRFVAYEDKPTVDREIGEYQSKTGTGYRIIFTDGIFMDDVPFEDRSLDPSNTFVVYENSIAERTILGANYFDVYNPDGTKRAIRYQIYTDSYMYVIDSYDFTGKLDAMATVVEEKTYSVGGVPIIEYPNNMWRMGDWEIVLSLMDAINELQSGRLDDIDQVVQSLLVFINADIDSENYAEMRESGVIVLKNTTNSKSEVQTISNTLDQAGMNMYALELQSLLYALIGIPDRNNRSGGGGDTGLAVELRDGWADLEVVARNKELMFKKSEKKALKIMLEIMNNSLDTDLSLLDIEIKFSRNKNNNLLVKTQSYSTLLATKTLTPEDCLAIVDLVSDVNEYVTRGEAFWGEMFANKNENEIPNTQNMNGEVEVAKVEVNQVDNGGELT